jgi:hypothetical protein
MKLLIKAATPAFFLLLVLGAGMHCTKKTDTASACKVCKVQGTGVDQQVIQKQVCTPDEEQAFRNANAGKTVTCN